MAPQPSSLTQEPNGLVGGYRGNSTAVKIIIGVLVSIVLFNAVELTVLILMTFHRYRGLYFWSLMLSATIGLIASGIGNLLHFFAIGPLSLALALSNIGFYFLVPAQSLVLYSRLHLILSNPRLLHFILCAVIFNGIVFAILVTVMSFGSAFLRTGPWNAGYTVIERLQVTWFCVQEFAISMLYIHETVKLLQLRPVTSNRRKNIMYQLLAINILIIMMDTVIVVIEFIGLYYIQVLIKDAIYSIKLKLEFAVLGKLTTIVEDGHLDLTQSDYSGCCDVQNGQSLGASDPTSQITSKNTRSGSKVETTNSHLEWFDLTDNMSQSGRSLHNGHSAQQKDFQIY
ncbi:uncharacterized protein N7496_002051 [Penicillium cataractarum]|uniref:DUF7703 domain-containing protein n=1 Tax=Penicillium cataractarum TaxID=2100454 RepID=A0A9W9VX61_9EURO|nr:uncharacterized protein N7496_002051 [Penicillium cataractarum]KAJ5390983.1 hypothetical protein N7496_002051 [Penicillium cataractarum]